MEDKMQNDIQEWLSLNTQGLFIEAKDFYFNHLFDRVINRFVKYTPDSYRCEVLFSILGYTPEPIILTQRALVPKMQVIFTTNKNYENDSDIISYLERYLTSEYKIIYLENDNFTTIYDTLRTQMNLYPSRDYAIDITGGKKSMVASASIFAKDYNCNVVYVDYDEYLPDLRRPMPGTERLNVVYSALKDISNTVNFNDWIKQRKNSNNSTRIITEEEKFRKAFSDVIKLGHWIPKSITLDIKSERRINFIHTESGKHQEIQRRQLYDFFSKCKDGKESAHKFITESSQLSNLFNSAIYALLDNINYQLYGKSLDRN